MYQMVNNLEQKDPILAQEIHQAAASLRTNPAMALSQCRRSLEKLLNQMEKVEGAYNLESKIKALADKMPQLVSTHMHFVRKLGNLGAHADENVDTLSAKQGLRSLIFIACWHYDIAYEAKASKSNKVGATARFFIADSIYRTWSKIAVLTPDGVLYSEYLDHMRPKTFHRSGFDFTHFTSDDFKFGGDEHGHGYQALREVSQQEAESFLLTRQANWVAGYLEQYRRRAR